MATIVELGQAVHARRAEMGLTQTYLAKLSGLSRQTINQIENGTVGNLSLNRAERLANVLGLFLHVAGNRSARAGSGHFRLSALDRAARTASVSYSRRMDPNMLRAVLRGSAPPPEYLPHLHALLDEAPVSLLASMVEQVEDEEAIVRADTWKRLRGLARQVRSKRDLWQ